MTTLNRLWFCAGLVAGFGLGLLFTLSFALIRAWMAAS